MFLLVLSGDMLYIFIDSLWPERKEVAVFAFLNYDNNGGNYESHPKRFTGYDSILLNNFDDC